MLQLLIKWFSLGSRAGWLLLVSTIITENWSLKLHVLYYDEPDLTLVQVLRIIILKPWQLHDKYKFIESTVCWVKWELFASQYAWDYSLRLYDWMLESRNTFYSFLIHWILEFGFFTCFCCWMETNDLETLCLIFLFLNFVQHIVHSLTVFSSFISFVLFYITDVHVHINN